MKKYFVLILLSLALLSCRPDYESSVKKYLVYQQKGKFEDAYALLSSQDKKIMPYEDYCDSQNMGRGALLVVSESHYEILSVESSLTGARASVSVLIEEPDLALVYERVPVLLQDSLSDRDYWGIVKNNRKVIRQCFTTKKMVYYVVNEDGNWRIKAGFNRQKRLFELNEKASFFESEHKVTKALSLYNEILDFDTSDRDIINKIAVLEERESYISEYLQLEYSVEENGVKMIIINKGTYLIKDVYLGVTIKGDKVSGGKVISFFDHSFDKNYIGYEVSKETIIPFDALSGKAPDYTLKIVDIVF